jgi:hypothetical protein
LRAGAAADGLLLAAVAEAFPHPADAGFVSYRLDAPLDLCQELIALARDFTAHEDARDFDAFDELLLIERFERRSCA